MFLLALGMIGTAAFAAGTAEDGRPGAPEGPATRWAEETTLTGTFQEADGYPMLEVDGKTYSVGVPGYRWIDVDLEPGDEVTVTGYLFEEARENDGHLRVTSATIDGAEYQLAPPRAAYGPRWSGRPGAYGPGMYGHRMYGPRHMGGGYGYGPCYPPRYEQGYQGFGGPSRGPARGFGGGPRR
jgi:hypothetical protein